MTNEDITKELTRMRKNFDPNSVYGSYCIDCLDAAIEALGKQIPRKAIGEHYAHMRCPSCNHRIPSGMGSSSRRRDNWCNYCGQKILWSDEG